MYITEQEQLSPEEIWQTLSDSQKEVCVYLSVSEWSSGVDKNYLDTMGLERGDVEELKKRGIVDVRAGWEFAQEFLDKNRDRIEEAEARLRSTDVKLTDDDRSFLGTIRNKRRVLENRKEEPRYRLAEETFHKFVESQLESK